MLEGLKSRMQTDKRESCEIGCPMLVNVTLVRSMLQVPLAYIMTPAAKATIASHGGERAWKGTKSNGNGTYILC